MTPRPGHAAALLAAGWLAALAGAQSATIVVTHDRPAGTMLPGEVLRVRATLSWTSVGGNYQPRQVTGDLVAAPDIGVSANVVSGALSPGPLIRPGLPVFGSVRGTNIEFGPTFVIPLPPYLSPLEFLAFDWTAPATPGVVEFNWIARPDVPNAMFYPVPSLSPIALPTTYLGTSITVIPAPASAMTLALAGLAMSTGRMSTGRRRRPNP